MQETQPQRTTVKGKDAFINQPPNQGRSEAKQQPQIHSTKGLRMGTQGDVCYTHQTPGPRTMGELGPQGKGGNKPSEIVKKTQLVGAHYSLLSLPT